MPATIQPPLKERSKITTDYTTYYSPRRVSKRKKIISKSYLSFALIACILATAIMLSLQQGNLFLKELVVSSLIILFAFINKTMGEQERVNEN